MFIFDAGSFIVGIITGYLTYLVFINFRPSLSRYMNQANFLDVLCFWFILCGFTDDQSHSSIKKRRNWICSFYENFHVDETKYSVKSFELSLSNDPSVKFRSYIVRLRSLEGKKLPLIVYCHAGGFIFGGWKINHGIVCSLADFGVAILYIDYLLCPDYSYPIQNENVIDSLNFVLDHKEDYDIDINKMIVIGQSQGTQMIPPVIQSCHERNDGSTIKGAIMIYGALPLGVNLLSFRKYSYGYGINMQQYPICYHVIYQHKDLFYEDYKSHFSPDLDYSFFPPFYIHICEYDVLRSTTENYCDTLRKNGVKVIEHLWKDCVHGCLNVGPVGHKLYLEIQKNIECIFFRFLS